MQSSGHAVGVVRCRSNAVVYRAAKIDEALLKQEKLYLDSRKAVTVRQTDFSYEALLKRLNSTARGGYPG